MTEGTWVVIPDPDVHREDAPVYGDGRLSVGTDLAGGYVELVASTLDNESENKSPPFPVPEDAVAIHDPDFIHNRRKVGDQGRARTASRFADETVEIVATVVEWEDPPELPNVPSLVTDCCTATAADNPPERGGA